jgi:hypothetical protein
MSESIPPPWTAEVAVDQSVVAAELLVPAAADEELPEAAGVLEEPELLQPAASKIDPTAAADATIAFVARKVNPPLPAPGVTGGGLHLG